MSGKTGWCLVQSDDRTSGELGDMERLMDRNKNMCARDGSCTYLRDPVDSTTVPSYWRKVHAVQKCLERNECGACLYVDTDAVVNRRLWKPHGASIDDLLESKDFGMTCDWGRDRFNAGVFAVRNNDTGRAIVDAWSKSRPASGTWTRDAAGKWSCTDPRTGRACPFAGEHYEQGAFTKHVMPVFGDRVHEASPHKWNNENYSTCEGTIKHFLGDYGTGDASGKRHAVRAFLNSSC